MPIALRAHQHHRAGRVADDRAIACRIDIGSDLGLTIETVSRTFSKLQADGLIEVMAGADRRVQRVRLTSLGQTRFTAMARAHERWIEALFADLTATEADDLTRLLERTKRSLHATTPEELGQRS